MLHSLFLVQAFSENCHIQLLLPFLSKVFFQKVITVVLLAALFLDEERADNIRKCLASAPGKAVLLLVLWMVLSVPLSVYPSLSLRFLMENFWKVLAGMLLVVGYTTTPGKLRKLVWAYNAALGVVGAVVVLFSSSGTARVSISEGIYDPNDTALQFLMALPFLVWTSLSERGFWRVVAAGIAVLLVLGILETKSRGGFLGLVAVTGVLLLQLRSSSRKGFVKAIVVVGAVASLVLVYGDNEYLERIRSIARPGEDYNLTSSTGRIELWKRGLDMMIHNPVLGVGVSTFISADGMLYSNVGARWNAAHNSFIQIGAELGFPGIALFCFLLFSMVRRVRSAGRAVGVRAEDRAIANAILCSFAAYVVGGFFLSAAYITSLYFLIAISFAFVGVQTPVSVREREALPSTS